MLNEVNRVGSSPIRQVSLERGRGNWTQNVQREDPMKTQREDGHLQANDRDCRRDQLHRHLILDFRAVRKSIVCLRPPQPVAFVLTALADE